jgi:hypothetical protein
VNPPPRLRPGDPVTVADPYGPTRRGVVVLPPTGGEILIRFADADRFAGPAEAWVPEEDVRRDGEGSSE